MVPFFYYPYTYAATLSSRLWRRVSEGEAKVILSVVYTSDTNMTELHSYKSSFDDVEGVVVKLEKETNLGCPLQSQLSRIFAYREEEIHEDDIVITTDVDIFVYDKRVLLPFKEPYDTWIFEYQHTVRTGCTFPMNLLGMTARNWRVVLEDPVSIAEPRGKYELISRFNTTLRGRFNNPNFNWGTDQVQIEAN